MIYRSEPYYYGGDADGRRGVWQQDFEIYSDVSGKLLNEDETYEYKDKHCSREELYELLGVIEIGEEDAVFKCSNCGQELNGGGDWIYYVNGDYYCENCFDEFIEEYKWHNEEENYERE